MRQAGETLEGLHGEGPAQRLAPSNVDRGFVRVAVGGAREQLPLFARAAGANGFHELDAATRDSGTPILSGGL